MTSEERAGLLVFGDDGSPAADVAWLWVGNHRWSGWTAEVVTAQPPPPGPPPDPDGSPVPWDSPHARLQTTISDLAGISHLLAQTDPRIALGERSDADLLVVGTPSSSRRAPFLVGSTAEWLLQHPPAPLAVVRSGRPVSDVVACLDGSPHAERALEAFASLPWAAETEVRLLSVDDGQSNVEQAQRRGLEILSERGMTGAPIQAQGAAGDAILGELESIEPQLVVLGTRGLTGWKRLRLGSTAGKVIRASGCSALVACTQDDDAD